MKNVRVAVRTNDSISIQMDNGMIRFPISAIKSINGVPTDGPPPVEEVTQAAPALATPVPTATATPAATPAEALPSPTAPPAPAATAAKPAESPAPAPASAPGASNNNWNFDILLVCLLVAAGLWMRGLQLMQQDLFERHAEPRYWLMAGVLLPLVGVGAYIAAQKIRPRNGPGVKAAPGGNTGVPFMNTPKFDPADHLARKGTTRKGLTFLDTERQSFVVKTSASEVSTGLDNAQEVLEEALLERASDIHIEPGADACRVRFRLDGIMHERMSFSTNDGLKIITAIKSLAEIDIAEKRKAQDGKFRVKSDGREVDFRVATATSIYGEKIVIRVLDVHGGVYDLQSLGMSTEMIEQFQRIINSRSGMILATGPTGSGKTSTLYAALRQLDGTKLNIMTIEDPVEYELASATQIAVNPRANITYEAGLRSILRQDPDVILVGEMRDAEAASVALRAALTGHLVFSSLHTKDAVGTITRLLDMGTERYQVASALLLVVAQRLVRVLCADCRKEYPAVGNELESVGITLDPGTPLYEACGCDACHGTGFRGRTGIFELLVLDDEFRQAFIDGQEEGTLTQMALSRGFRTYRHDGAEKALKGITTVDEVVRAS